MKKRVQKRPTGVGIPVVKETGLPHKVGLTIDLVWKKLVITPKSHEGDYTDNIEVHYLKRLLDVDGEIIREKTMSYTLKDTGDLCEYDLYEETVFDQADIDNPAYIVEGDPVTRIYYIDGQIDDGDGNMIDNEIEIDPLYRKGQIDPSTEVVITSGSTPLNQWTNNWGNEIGVAVLNNILNRN